MVITVTTYLRVQSGFICTNSRKHLKLTAALLDLFLECHSAVEEMSETLGKLIDKCNRP